MANKECLNLFKDRLLLYAQKQLVELADNIRTIKARRSAEGSLRSGATIREGARLFNQTLASRVEYISSVLKDLPFSYSSDLRIKILEIVRKYFTDDLGGFRDLLDDIIHVANGAHVRDRIINEARKTNRDHVLKLEIELDEFLLKLKSAQRFSGIDKIALSIEVICLLTMAFLAGKWSSDPSGNYEPYIVIIGIIAPVLEIGRRVIKRYAT